MGYRERPAPRGRPRRVGGGGAVHRPGCQHAEQGVRRARAARPRHARGLVPRAQPAHRRGRRHGHRRHAHARGVRARLPARRVEHAGWRAGAAPRRAGEAPGHDHRRPLRRPHALVPRRRVRAKDGPAESGRRGEERDHGLGAGRASSSSAARAAGRPSRRRRAARSPRRSPSAWPPTRASPSSRPKRSKALLARRDRENIYVLDVRTSEEYAASHIAGAVWAPGGQAVQAHGRVRRRPPGARSSSHATASRAP